MGYSGCSTFSEAPDGTTVEQLCFSLGYKELSAGLPSRGEPNVLLNDLRGFVNSQLDDTSSPCPSSMASVFLGEFGAGEDLWAKPFKKLLSFPRDANRQV